MKNRALKRRRMRLEVLERRYTMSATMQSDLISDSIDLHGAAPEVEVGTPELLEAPQ